MSEHELIVKKFHGAIVNIEFFSEEMYFDISGVAASFGKRLSDWEELKSTKEYFAALKSGGDFSPTFDFIIRGKRGSKKALLHKSVFVEFARWVSVGFNVWANKVIEEILFEGKVLCEKERTQYINQIETAQREIKKLQVKNHKTYKYGNMSLSKYLKDRNIPLTLETAFEKLTLQKVIERRDVVISRRFLTIETFGVQNSEGVIEFNPRALDTVFEEYVGKAPSLFDGVEE